MLGLGIKRQTDSKGNSGTRAFIGSLTPVKMSPWEYLKPRPQIIKNMENFQDAGPRRQCYWVLIGTPMTHAGGTQLLLDNCVMSSAFWTGDQGICEWDRHSPIDLLRCSTNGGTVKGNFLPLGGFEHHVLCLGTVCLVSVIGGQNGVPWCWDRKACSLLGVVSPKHRLSSLRSFSDPA